MRGKVHNSERLMVLNLLMSKKLFPSVIGKKEIFWLYVHIFQRLDFKSSAVLVDPSVRPLFIGVPLSKAAIVDV